MSVFATELPVTANLTKAKFAAAAIAWVRGIKNSKSLDNADAKELYDDELWLETADGETLSIKSFEATGTSVFGVRLEIPDAYGRRWRTECVYTSKYGRGILRVRGQCLATTATAPVATPLKPHLVSMAIDDGWAAKDRSIKPTNEPIYLTEDDLDLAAHVILGKATTILPNLYIS